MSSRWSRLLVLGVVLVSTKAVAQDVATLRARLARVEAQADSMERLRAAESLARRARAQVGTHGSVVVILPAGTRPGTASDVARLVDSLIRAVAAFDPVLMNSYVLVAEGLAGVGQNNGSIAGRTEVTFVTWTSELSGRGDRATAENAAWELLRALVSRTRWDQWLESALPAVWVPRRDNPPLVDAMVAEHWSRGRGCLAGSAEDCAAYLGLDDSPDPLRYRFTAADLRTELGSARWAWGLEDRACLAGDDEACYRVTERRFQWRTSPSSANARRSMMFFVRSAYGGPALRQLLADTAGTEGQRFSRATGKPVAGLAAEWRGWLLASSGRTPVRAGMKESLATLLAVGVMLALATRSGRWRV